MAAAIIIDNIQIIINSNNLRYIYAGSEMGRGNPHFGTDRFAFIIYKIFIEFKLLKYKLSKVFLKFFGKGKFVFCDKA
jgi:hypothetical protein